jgi:hypothetical protein
MPTALGFAWFFIFAALVFCAPVALAFYCFVIGLLVLPLCLFAYGVGIFLIWILWPFLDFLLVY